MSNAADAGNFRRDLVTSCITAICRCNVPMQLVRPMPTDFVSKAFQINNLQFVARTESVAPGLRMGRVV